MRELTPCINCGQRISPEADSCPNCKKHLSKCRICDRWQDPSETVKGCHKKCYDELFSVRDSERCPDCDTQLSTALGPPSTWPDNPPACPKCGRPSVFYNWKSKCYFCRLPIHTYQSSNELDQWLGRDMTEYVHTDCLIRRKVNMGWK
jgi:predicted amidophosphoribosyltransferase